MINNVSKLKGIFNRMIESERVDEGLCENFRNL